MPANIIIGPYGPRVVQEDVVNFLDTYGILTTGLFVQTLGSCSRYAVANVSDPAAAVAALNGKLLGIKPVEVKQI